MQQEWGDYFNLQQHQCYITLQEIWGEGVGRDGELMLESTFMVRRFRRATCTQLISDACNLESGKKQPLGHIKHHYIRPTVNTMH